MSYPCYYTNLCPHKPHKHAHAHTHAHTHTHTHTQVSLHYKDSFFKPEKNLVYRDFPFTVELSNKKINALKKSEHQNTTFICYLSFIKQDTRHPEFLLIYKDICPRRQKPEL